MDIMRFNEKPAERYPFKCAQCGKDDTIYFPPYEDKPLYCAVVELSHESK